MRIETTSRTLYSFDELSDEAKDHAIQKMQEAQYEWVEADMLADDIIYGIAEKFRAPGWDEYGAGDFPGIDGFKVEEWDLYRRNIEGSGMLTRDTAPALPWGPFAEYHFESRDHLCLAAYEDEDGFVVEVVSYRHDPSISRDDAEAFDILDQAIREALAAGLDCAQSEVDYLTSEEYAREYLRDNFGEDFDEEGELS